MTSSDFLEKMKGHGPKPAVLYREREYSYANLLDAIGRATDDLRSVRVARHQVVALASDYTFYSIACFFALLQNGNVIVPLPSRVEQEAEERIRESYADFKLVLREEKGDIFSLGDERPKHALFDELRRTGSSGLVLFSSGSTGKPKAMLHDLDRLLAAYQDRPGKSNRMMVFLMFDHIGGLNTLFNSLATGSLLAIPESRDPDYICRQIEKHRLNILPASPTFLNLLLLRESYNNYDLSSLSLITYGTEPMSASLLQRVHAAFPSVKLLQTFGTSETGIAKTFSRSSESTLVKLEDPQMEFRIVEGELWIRSRTRILGYLNAPMDDFTEDGWYRTGDLVAAEADGYLRIVGRIKEVINVGGQKVLPEEVENVLLQCPAVADCLVYGEKNAIMGQIVAADLVLKNPEAAASIRKEVRIFCRRSLEDYKIPSRINLVERTNFNERFKKIRRKNPSG